MSNRQHGTRGGRRGGSAIAALVLIAGIGAAAPLEAQEEVAGEATGSALAAAAGGLIGLAAGGYANLAIVVTKARFGHYPHSFRDAFGWESTPIVAGGATGVALGLIDSGLLLPWVLGGAAGVGIGTGIGLLYGHLAWGDPASRWADAAIGAALGMAIGSTYMIAREYLGDDGGGTGGAAVAPALRLPLFRFDF